MDPLLGLVRTNPDYPGERIVGQPPGHPLSLPRGAAVTAAA
jgi:hypothetical protein